MSYAHDEVRKGGSLFSALRADRPCGLVWFVHVPPPGLVFLKFGFHDRCSREEPDIGLHDSPRCGGIRSSGNRALEGRQSLEAIGLSGYGVSKSRSTFFINSGFRLPPAPPINVVLPVP